MDVGAITSNLNPANLPLDQLAANPNISEGAKVMEASRQFEAVFLRQILSEARKTVISSGEKESTANGIYDDMVNNQLADDISRSGEFGLAKSLQAQLVHQVLPPSSPGTTATISKSKAS